MHFTQGAKWHLNCWRFFEQKYANNAAENDFGQSLHWKFILRRRLRKEIY